ncbi:MAG: hypothetical protein HUU34_20200 [Saprospiraceae bacterium]|nr:hypothetical protein [Saprospiraceae bacterium]
MTWTYETFSLYIILRAAKFWALPMLRRDLEYREAGKVILRTALISAHL